MSEVWLLIKQLKEFLNHPQISIPTVGKYKKECVVSEKNGNIEYKLKIYRGNLNVKYSLHLRFVGNNEHLVRLCINGSKHHNDDGTVISPNHLHIYDFHDNYIESKAYELDELPFDKHEDLSESAGKFLDFLKINK